VTGAIGGDVLANNNAGVSLAYNNAHVVGATSITASGSTALSITSSTSSSVATDYTYTPATIADVSGSITAKAISGTGVTIGGTTTKVYDGGTTATGATLSAGSVTGGIGGDVLANNNAGVSLAYNNAHVVGATSITASGSTALSITSSTSSSVATDYTYTPATIADVSGSITAKAISGTGVTIGGTTTKVYDGGTTATGATLSAGSVTGGIGGDVLANNNAGVSLAYNN